MEKTAEYRVNEKVVKTRYIMVLLEDPREYDKVLKIQQKKMLYFWQKTLRVANQESLTPVGVYLLNI